MAFPASAALVQSAMEALGLAGEDTEFSRRLKLGEHGPGKVGRWRTGRAQPNYEATMKILDLCGWLSIGGAVPSQVSPRDPLAEIAEGVTELLEQQAELLRRTPSLPAPRKSRSAAAPKRRATGR